MALDLKTLKDLIGSSDDNASSTGSLFARIKHIVTARSTSNVGNPTDSANAEGSLWARIKHIVTARSTSNVGNPTDSANAEGSLWARFTKLISRIGTSSSNASSSGATLWGYLKYHISDNNKHKDTHVTVQNSVGSSSTTDACSAWAVKLAYDRATSALNAAGNGNINTITLLDKSFNNISNRQYNILEIFRDSGGKLCMNGRIIVTVIGNPASIALRIYGQRQVGGNVTNGGMQLYNHNHFKTYAGKLDIAHLRLGQNGPIPTGSSEVILNNSTESLYIPLKLLSEDDIVTWDLTSIFDPMLFQYGKLGIQVSPPTNGVRIQVLMDTIN